MESPPPTPDFVISYLRMMRPSDILDILGEGSPVTLLLPLVVIVALIASIFLWAWGITFKRRTVVLYLSPASVAMVDFILRFRALGNGLAGMHVSAPELKPLFAAIFIPLYLGVFTSAFLVAVAGIVHAAKLLLYRHPTHPH